MALDWLVASFLEKTYQYSQELQRKGLSPFNVRNNIQVFHAQTLSIVYAQVSQEMILLNHFRWTTDSYLYTFNCFWFISISEDGT